MSALEAHVGHYGRAVNDLTSLWIEKCIFKVCGLTPFYKLMNLRCILLKIFSYEQGRRNLTEKVITKLSIMALMPFSNRRGIFTVKTCVKNKTNMKKESY